MDIRTQIKRLVQIRKPNTIPPGARQAFLQYGAECVWMSDGVLVIRGSDGWSDWNMFNLNTKRVKGSAVTASNQSSFTWSRFDPKIANAIWYRGFAKHALRIKAQINGLRGQTDITGIVGHSLGGASAQILAAHFNVPAITTAAPPIYFGGGNVHGARRCLNILYDGDKVMQLATITTSGGGRLGRLHRITRRPEITGDTHRPATYLSLADEEIGAGRLNASWR